MMKQHHQQILLFCFVLVLIHGTVVKENLDGEMCEFRSNKTLSRGKKKGKGGDDDDDDTDEIQYKITITS